MNAVPLTVGAPRTPLVDLLPPEIELHRKAKRAKALIGVALILFLVVLVGAWYGTFAMRKSVESDRAAEELKTPDKKAELATYDYVPLVYATLDNAVTARAWAGGSDITWATQLNSLISAIPTNVALTSMAVSAATPSEPFMLDGTPFQQPDLGQLFFSGDAASEAEVTALQDAIDALPAFRNTYITSVAIAAGEEGDVPYWTFTGTTRITSNALSGRTVTEQLIVIPSPSAESEG